tara:strand:- start:2084 stop:2302 length:219 start_codon:yes stop_codon:yes gene_type:complete
MGQPRHKHNAEVDHIIPHKGPSDPLFWDKANLQVLAKQCHSRKTAEQDGAFGRAKQTPRAKTGPDGWPVEAE